MALLRKVDYAWLAMMCVAAVVCVAIEGSAAHQNHHHIAVDAIDTSTMRNAGADDANSSSVRCFCNLPACISTGYMCKSTYGGCFSDVHSNDATKSGYRGRHGCVEYLNDREQRDRCRRLPNGNRMHPARRRLTTEARNASHAHAPVHCCHEDMCNHVDSTAPPVAARKDVLQQHHDDDDDDENRIVDGYSDADVWFKAATIAVPICGAVILFVLIAMAIRLLRTESSFTHASYKLGCRAHAHYCRPLADARIPPAPIIRKKDANDECTRHANNESYKSPMLDAHAYDNATNFFTKS